MKKYLVLVISSLLLFSVPAFATLAPTPQPKAQFFDNNGKVLNGGLIYTYQPGTTTPMATYTDSTGTVANANPIVLDSAGRAAIWLSGFTKFVVKTAAGVTLYTADNVSAAVPQTADTVSFWIESGVSPTYLSTTSFSVSGDQTSIFQVGRRIKSTNTSGDIYSTVLTSTFSVNSTTVTVVNDSGTLDTGLESVYLSVLTPENSILPQIPSYTKTTSYAITAADCGKKLISNGTGTVTFTLPSTMAPGCEVISKNTTTAWTATGTPTYVSGTVFTLVGDQRSLLPYGKRLKSTNTSSALRYHQVVLATYDGTNTTITIANETSGIDSGLSAISYMTTYPLIISGTVDGYTNPSLDYNDEITIWSDGTSYFGKKKSLSGANAIVLTDTNGKIPLARMLVYDSGSISTAVTSITVTGLDAATAGGYDFEFTYYNPLAGDCTYRLFYNNDKTTTNYNWIRVGLSVANDAKIFDTVPTLSTTTLYGHINITPGGFAIMQAYGGIRTSAGSFGITGTSLQTKVSSVTNITQIDFVADQSGGIGANSRFRMWKRIQ